MIKRITIAFIAFFSVTVFFFSCKKAENVDVPNNWVAAYSDIVLGDQNNTSNGHFLKPQTGESIKLSESKSQQRSLALLFFTESGGANSFISFPADGTQAATFGTAGNKLFTSETGGINSWDQSFLNAGLIADNTSMSVTEFNTLKASNDWTKFDQAFANQNGGKADLSYKLSYTLNPKSGAVMLVQFNGLVRAIICIKTVVTSGSSGGSLRFDMIVEGRSIYTNNTEANLLQPKQK